MGHGVGGDTFSVVAAPTKDADFLVCVNLSHVLEETRSDRFGASPVLWRGVTIPGCGRKFPPSPLGRRKGVFFATLNFFS